MAFACLDELRHGVDARFDPETLLAAKEVGEWVGFFECLGSLCVFPTHAVELLTHRPKHNPP